jgi:hypothetical protein
VTAIVATEAAVEIKVANIVRIVEKETSEIKHGTPQ